MRDTAHTDMRSSERGQPIVASYIRTWPLNGGTGTEYWTADTIRGEYITDLLIAFALIDPADGTSLYMREAVAEASSGAPVSSFPDLWGQVALLKKKFPHMRVELSVGGGGAEGFSDMANDPALRGRFVGNVIDWIERYDLDGADIDWEFPVGGEWVGGIKTRKEDRENYVALLSDIRAALDALSKKTGKTYKLYTAIPSAEWFPRKNDVVSASRAVDAFFMMCYDYYGPWSRCTGHQANLYTNPNDPAKFSTDRCVRTYLDAGIPAEKIVVGVPFYGRGWKGVPPGANPETPGLYQPFTGDYYGDGIAWPDLRPLLGDPALTQYYDTVAKARYIYNGDIMISFMDKEGIADVAKYTVANGLGGVMSWEYRTDIEAELLKVLAEAVR